MGKVVSLKELSEIVNKIRVWECGLSKVVQCHGVFDILHIGHKRHFEEAKSFGDVLIVTVTPDKFVGKGPDRPIFGETLRAEMVAGLGVVDYVAINEYPTAVEAIQLIKPDVYVKGREYLGLGNDPIVDEEKAVCSVGGTIKFTDDIVFSSSKLSNSFKLPEKTIDYLNSFKYNYGEVADWINKIESLKVLVIGEVIVDEYQYGESIGKSGKSPIVAFKLGKSERYEGGTLAIRNHLNDFVSSVDVVKSNIIVKKRYVEGDQKLFETYSIDEHHTDICVEIIDTIDSYDLVLVADFGHGLLTSKLRRIVKDSAKFLAVGTQRNAGNMGHNTIRKYWDRNNNIYICIDGDELRLAVHEKYDRDYPLIDIVKNELPQCSIVTSGPDGCISNGEVIPAMTTNVVDTVGAGDALLALTSPLVCVGAPMGLVGFVGCAAAAIKISYMGNKEYVAKKALLGYIKTLLKR